MFISSEVEVRERDICIIYNFERFPFTTQIWWNGLGYLETCLCAPSCSFSPSTFLPPLHSSPFRDGFINETDPLHRRHHLPTGGRGFILCLSVSLSQSQYMYIRTYNLIKPLCISYNCTLYVHNAVCTKHGLPTSMACACSPDGCFVNNLSFLWEKHSMLRIIVVVIM